MCKIERGFREGGICGSDVRRLVRDWQLVHRIIRPRAERGSEKKLMDNFLAEMLKFRDASKVLHNRDVTIGVDMEEDNENDMDWTPTAGST